MLKRPKNKTIVKALRECKGIVSYAAKKIGVHRNTLHTWVANDPELASVIAEARESLVDLAEMKLVDSIEGGDLKAIQFFLETQGKGRGYTKQKQIEHSGGVETQHAGAVQIFLPYNGRDGIQETGDDDDEDDEISQSGGIDDEAEENEIGDHGR